MTTKIKVAYSIFLVSFSLWLFLFGIAVFPAITTGSQIQFPDSALQTLFLGAAITTSIGCLLVGANLLLFGIYPIKQKGTLEKTKSIQGKLLATQAAKAFQNQMENDYSVYPGESQETMQTIEIIAKEEQEVLVAKKKKK